MKKKGGKENRHQRKLQFHVVESYLDTQKLYSHICEYKNNSEKDKISFLFLNPLTRKYSLHGKLQLFWVCYVEVRLMLAIPAPHSELLPKTGVLVMPGGVQEEWGCPMRGVGCCMEPRAGHDP